ncbi:hypothetical protein GBAR_LOCUS28696 [Geodia barretti]|uniref:Uncharacterized protein n=1 Tax=Geodia barretti TaxID=519541 RepID=A0AA35TRL6_GEOBA|nr:hypothetical protein GBAR_LOCUS28696 [Geodia barretti]
MTCIMDPVYQRPHQPMWGPSAAPVPTLEMEYYVTHPPFTSPPATPMTPVTPHPHIFNPPHYEAAIPAPPPNPFPPAPQQSYPPLDFRLFALCQQLLSYSQIPETHQKAFWDQFMMEYFTENATLTVGGDFGEGHRKYS